MSGHLKKEVKCPVCNQTIKDKQKAFSINTRARHITYAVSCARIRLKKAL